MHHEFDHQQYPVEVTTRLCAHQDHAHFLPKRRRAPSVMPANVPIPRVDEVIYLSSSSAWKVSEVIYEWRAQTDLHIEVWIEHIGPGRYARPTGFELTQ